MAKKRATDQEILDQFPAARARASKSLKTRPHATEVRYDARNRTLHVRLTNGGSFSLPVGMIRELRDASDDVIGEVEIGPAGVGLHWNALDADLSVERLAGLVWAAARY